MCKDLRFKHSAKKRAESVKLFEQGFGYKAAATILKISRYTVKEWCWVYKALGEVGLLDMGKTFKNIIDRDFDAKKPWQKMGTDVTEFKVAGKKAYLAPILDFCTKEIVAWNVSEHPNMTQQLSLLEQLLSKMPNGCSPVLHSDMGWQYQHAGWTEKLKSAGITQSMSRKGNCIDNAATEQLFGHIKDEFYRNQTWSCFADFKSDLDSYISLYNNRRRQVRLNGLTPIEFREQATAS